MLVNDIVSNAATDRAGKYLSYEKFCSINIPVRVNEITDSVLLEVETCKHSKGSKKKKTSSVFVLPQDAVTLCLASAE